MVRQRKALLLVGEGLQCQDRPKYLLLNGWHFRSNAPEDRGQIIGAILWRTGTSTPYEHFRPCVDRASHDFVHPISMSLGNHGRKSGALMPRCPRIKCPKCLCNPVSECFSDSLMRDQPRAGDADLTRIPSNCTGDCRRRSIQIGRVSKDDLRTLAA